MLAGYLIMVGLSLMNVSLNISLRNYKSKFFVLFDVVSWSFMFQFYIYLSFTEYLDQYYMNLPSFCYEI